MKLSVVIIAQNEADRLGDALESCRTVADEMVVVDGGSTDATVALAIAGGARVEHYPFHDFATQKNTALDCATGDWVLNLDADERLSPELRQEILVLKTGGPVDKTGYAMPRLPWYLGRFIRHSGWYPECKVRLFKKEGARWQGRVHERLIREGPTGRLRGPILHYTYRDISDHVQRINRYSSFQAFDLANRSTVRLLLGSLLFPGFRFVRHYLWKLGFLDGWPGLVIAAVSAWSVALKYWKALEIKRAPKPPS
jgi:glycosyltransferase involved in cell wall biosynthesis